MLPRLALTFALAALVCPPFLYAQSTQSEPDAAAPAHVSHVEGTVSLEREGRAETSLLNMPLLSGDRLRTVDGRVEVLFADGSTLHLDARSTIDVQSDDLVRLTDGRLRLNILGPQRAVAYRIDSPAGSARITQPGEYRIAFLRSSTEAQLELAVVRGAAEVFTDQGATPVRAGERAYASAGLMPSYAYAYNSATQDAFDRWSESRRDVRIGVSSQHLPSDMQAYAPLLDESGDWRQTESYGYAWYPRVAPDWRPYYHGRWDSYPRYGWTWIGADRFAWPTHHYGRWGFSAGAWFWIPSSRWAPHYVSWAYAPGYVSWCPLGFDNRPIFAVNVFRTGYSPWRGWTALSYSHFGSRGYSVHSRAVNWDRFAGQRPRFEQRSSAPGSRRDIAVPRNATPIRWAGSRDLPRQSPPRADSPRLNSPRDSGRDIAVPRGTASPRYVNRGDEIVRSQTERPSPRAGSGVTRPDVGGYAIPRSSGPSAGPGPSRAEPRGGAGEARPFERNDIAPRTSPDAAARPSRSESTPFDSAPRAFDRAQPRSNAPSSNQPRARASGCVPSYEPYGSIEPRGAAGTPRAQPRMDGSQDRPSDPSTGSGSSRAESRGEAPQARPRSSGGAPSYDPYQPRTYEPRSAAPRREDGPRSYERPRPAEAQSPRGGAAERAPDRAGPTPRSAPSGGGGGGGAVPRRGRGGA